MLGLFPSATQRCKASIRRASNLVALEMAGTFEDGEAWISAQQIDFAGNALWKGLVLLPDTKQGLGLAKLLMRNCYDVAKGLGLGSLRLRAMEIGSYAWLRYGFKPDQADWNGAMKFDIAARLGELLEAKLVNNRTADRVYRLLDDATPEAANAIAAERERVPGRHRDAEGMAIMVPLGQALIAEANGGIGTSWNGSLDLGDDQAVAVFLEYTRPRA